MTTRITPLAPSATTPFVLSRALAGNLAERPLTRLLHSLWVQSWTGSVLVAIGGQRRRFAMQDGIIGTVTSDPERERRLLLETFAWAGGTYRLDSGDVPSRARFASFGEVLPLLLEGVFDHASGRDLMRQLAVVANQYPIPTQHLEARVGLLGRPRLARLIQATCNGRHTLDTVIKRSQTDPVSLMRLVYFALETHMLILIDEPGGGVLHLEYQNLRRDHESKRGPGERRRLGRMESRSGRPSTSGFARVSKSLGEATTQVPDTANPAATPFLEPHPSFLRGERLMARGRHEEAVDALAEALATEPRNPAYLTEHLWARHASGQIGANDAARQAIELLPHYGAWGKSRIHTVLGRIAKLAGRDEAAQQQFEAATQCDPQAVEARREQRLYHMRQNTAGGDSWVDKLFGKPS
jgi:hypothetical protein